MRSNRRLVFVLACAVFLPLVPTATVQASHGGAHATIKYWDVGQDPVIRGFDPHETLEDLQGLTGHVSTPEAPLTLITSMENTRGGFCGPMYWNPVTNHFKTYPVTGGLQVAVALNEDAPVLTQGSKTFQPGDTWYTVQGNPTYGVYVHFRGTDNFRRYENLSGAAVGLRMDQRTGKVYVAEFSTNSLLEFDPATNTGRRWDVGNRPYWLDIDTSGRVYTTAASANGFPDQVVRLDPATGEIRRWDIPGGGLQASVTFGMGNGNRVDGDGHFWFSLTTAGKVGRLIPGTNTMELYTRSGLSDPNGIASSGSGTSQQTFFTQRNANRIGLLTVSSGVPAVSSVTPATATGTATTVTPTPRDFVITPYEATIPPQTFDSEGDLDQGIIHFPFPPGVTGPAGMSRVAAPGTIYGSLEGSDHVFGIFSDAIIAPPGGCPDGPSISLTVTRPAPGRIYEDDVDVGSSGSSAIVVRGSPLTVEATSSDPASTQQVEVFVDGVLAGTDTTAPYAVTVPTLLTPGSHPITVTAIEKDRPACRAVETVVVIVECFDVLATIDRPVFGRVYDDDIDVGASGGDALVLGGDITVTATSSNPARTARVDFQMNNGPPVADPTDPYQATFDADPLPPGLHQFTATAVEENPHCTNTATKLFRKPDPSLKGVAQTFFAATNVPVEPQVWIGGAEVGPTSGSDFIRIVEQPLPPVVDHLNVATDQSQGSTAAGNFYAESDSLITGVSLLGGLITADVLHARVRAELDIATVTASTSDAGTEIVNLRIGGNQILAYSQPNLRVDLPDDKGHVIVQETVVDGAGARQEITVNMIHVFARTPDFKGEIIVGSAHAGVNLAGNVFFGPETDLIHRPDDAGTKADAGDDAATAVPISANPGFLSGSMTPGDDLDVYSFQARQGLRVISVLKPAEREVVRVNRMPQAPPPLTVPGITGFVLDAVAAISAQGPYQPNFDLVLRDPTGEVRAVSTNAGSLPDRVELNIDLPWEPEDAVGTWTLEISRTAGSPDGFYSLSLGLLPVPLREQDDADQPGDASDLCSGARVLDPQIEEPGEVTNITFAGVIRDDDQSDFYEFSATVGQLITVVVKPDELADGADLDLFLYTPRFPGGVQECSSPFSGSTNGKSIAKALPEAVLQLPAEFTGTYGIEVRRINAVANYYVNVNVTNPLPTLPDNDAFSGTDAPGACTAVGPIALSSGVYQGRLSDYPTNDLEDWYDVDLAPGQDLVAIMKPSELSNFDLELYDPSCNPVPPGQGTVNHQPTSVPETVRIVDAAGGRYKLRVVKVSGGGNYMLGVAVTP